jgi:hypothetical protein
MNLVNLIEYLRNHLKTVVWVSLGVLALVFLFDAVCVNKEHAHTHLEHLRGFWSIFGFVGCALIIVLSKWYGHAGIMTREDYYGPEEPEEEKGRNDH